MTSALRNARRPLVASVGLVVTAICMTGCEPANDFSITNATNQPLTVQERHQHPGQSPSLLNPGDWKATLRPGQKLGLQLDLSRGVCIDVEFLAYDASGRLVAQDPTPICEDTHGHGSTWTILAK